MPVASSIRELMDALRDRQTNTTKALRDLFGSPVALNTLRSHSNWGDGHPLNSAYILGDHQGAPLPGWARGELTAATGSSGLVNRGLNQDEIAHIENWDHDQKEAVRKVVVEALNGNRPPLKFFWELHGGSSEETIVPSGGATDEVIFRTPQSHVTAPPPTLGKITIKVGP